MLTILQQLLYLYIFLFIGWLLGKLKKEQVNHTGVLSFLLVNLFLPAKVFGTFAQNFTPAYISENRTTILLSLGLLLLLSAIAIPLSNRLTRKPYEKRVYRYSLTVSNYGYMGYVLAEDLFGAQGLTNLILFCIPFAFYTYTFGYSMLTGGEKSVKRLFTPLTMSILLGIVVGLTGLALPSVIDRVLSAASACVGPISMVLTGLALSAFTLRELVTDKTAYIVVALRLVLLPLAVFGLFKLLVLVGIATSAALASAILMASMPCGLNTIVFPKLVGEDCKPGARLAFLSHLLSLATLPIWLSVLM